MVGRWDGVNEPAVYGHWRIRFPFLVVEGKSYATGETVFEAENQAAVSGACPLNPARSCKSRPRVASSLNLHFDELSADQVVMKNGVCPVKYRRIDECASSKIKTRDIEQLHNLIPRNHPSSPSTLTPPCFFSPCFFSLR